MYAKRPAYSPHIRLAKALLIAGTPVLAVAAQQTIAVVSPIEEISALTWFFIVLFAAIGWAVADIDKVAELWNVDGQGRYQQMVARLKLVKSVIGSLAAGVFTYFLAKLAPAFVVGAMGLKLLDGRELQLHEFVILIMVAGAGWLGSRWFERAFGAGGPNP